MFLLQHTHPRSQPVLDSMMQRSTPACVMLCNVQDNSVSLICVCEAEQVGGGEGKDNLGVQECTGMQTGMRGHGTHAPALGPVITLNWHLMMRKNGLLPS